jgi:CDP-diglyceride synthetase
MFGREAIHRRAVLAQLDPEHRPIEVLSTGNDLYHSLLAWELWIVVAVAFLLQAAVGLVRSGRVLTGAAIAAWAIYFPFALFHADLYPDVAWVDGGAGRAGVALAPAVALVAVGLALTRRADLARASSAALLALWLVPALPWLQYVHADYGNGGLIALFLLSKIGDTAGYYAGSAFGRHHPFKRLSPGKTTEGCLASLAAGVGAGALCVGLDLLPCEPFGLVGGLLAGAAINLAAQAGDLLESWIKRRAGVKDSGTWFGPSGGVLDLIDSLLLGVPVAIATWPLLFDVAGPG